MLPPISDYSFLPYPLVGLHIVRTDFKLKCNKLSIDASNDIWSAFGTPSPTMNIERNDSLPFEIVHALLLEVAFFSQVNHPNLSYYLRLVSHRFQRMKLVEGSLIE